jgi:hypothetical protein
MAKTAQAMVLGGPRNMVAETIAVKLLKRGITIAAHYENDSLRMPKGPTSGIDLVIAFADMMPFAHRIDALKVECDRVGVPMVRLTKNSSRWFALDQLGFKEEQEAPAIEAPPARPNDGTPIILPVKAAKPTSLPAVRVGVAQVVTAARPAVQYETVMVTPEMAAHLLKNMVRNRVVRESRVIKIALDIEAGKWHMTGSAVAFNADGQLIDGQHRLRAVVLAATPVPMLFAHNLSNEALAVIDTGAPRAMGDIYTMVDGVGDGKKFATMLGIVHGLDRGHMTTGQSKAALDATRARHQDGTDYVMTLLKRGGPRLIHIGSVHGALAFAYPTKPEAISEFAEKLWVGANLAPNDPAFVLRGYLLNRPTARTTRDNGYSLACRCLRAMYAAVEGATIDRNRLYATESSRMEFAKAHGAPVVG